MNNALKNKIFIKEIEGPATIEIGISEIKKKYTFSNFNFSIIYFLKIRHAILFDLCNVSPSILIISTYSKRSLK